MHQISLHFRIFLCFFASLCILACSQIGWTQATTASLQVSASDSSGARIPAAQANILNVGTGATQTVTTDATGVALFPRLAVGQYKLTVDKEGFTQYVQSGITLTVGQSASADVILQVGAASNKVTVTSQVPLVDTRSFGSNQLIGEKQVVDLPLNGRQAAQLLQTAAGTSDIGHYQCIICAQGGVYPGAITATVNGSQRTTTNYQLDGISNNDTYINSPLPFPNPDAIQEFALQSSNFSAEYGNAAGGVVNVVSKSGTNQFHGDAFEFLRNGGLDANNYFSHGHDELHQNQYGGTLGGPILKNKLFFFGSYQGTRNSSVSAAGNAHVPDAAERTGDFSELLTQNPPIQLNDPVTGLPTPGDIIPQSRLDPVSQNVLKYIPLPNGPNGLLNFSTGALRTQDDQYLAKIDYSRGKNQLTGHYFYTKYLQPAIVPTTNILTTKGGDKVRIQTVSINHTYLKSPTLLFNTTFGLVRQSGGSTSGAPFSIGSLGAKIASSTPPQISFYVDGGFFYFLTGHQGQFNRGDTTIREDVTKIVGRHELHFGGQALNVYNKLTNTINQSGYIDFYGALSGYNLADLLYGRINYFAQGGGQYGNIVGTQYGFFAQDNWRATDALTITAGLRWDPWLPFSDAQGRTVCFVPGQQSVRYPNAPNGQIFGGSNHDAGCPRAGSDRYLPQFGPRVGFAYQLAKDGSRSIRGGFGVYYAPPETANYTAGVTAPFSPQFSFNNVQLSDPYGSLGIPNPFPAQYGPALPGPSATFTLPVSISSSFSKNFRPLTQDSWNLILEQQLGKTSVARLAYIGNYGSHLSEEIQRELNPAIYIPGQSTEANTQQRRPYQNFGTVLQNQSDGISNYNALQASFEKRMSTGLTLTANYTWSKSLDNVSDYSNGQWTDPFDRNFDYGPPASDVTNNFKFSEVWVLPAPPSHGPIFDRLARGWEITSFAIWQSGYPFSINSGVDNSFSGVGHDRADYLGGPINLSRGRSHIAEATKWFNTSQFAPNAIGTFGTSSRNQVRGPRYFNADVSALKNTKIAGNLNLQIRADAFNAFNNVNLGLPQSNQSAINFGQITSALPPRIMQLSAKIVF